MPLFKLLAVLVLLTTPDLLQAQNDFLNGLGLTSPTGMSVDAAGNLYLAEQGRVRRIDLSSGEVATLVIGPGRAVLDGDTARTYSYDVKLDSNGSLYWSDTAAHMVKRMDAITGAITVIAGTGDNGYSGDGGSGFNAALSLPTGLAIDGAALYIADSGNHTVRRVDLITGMILTIAGTGSEGISADGGKAVDAKLSSPNGIVADNAGNIFISEMGSHRIRRVDGAAGLISTVAGIGSAGYNGDGIAASQASLRSPGLMTFDLFGNLIFADAANNKVRMVDASTGLIWTIAGARAASLKGPAGVAVTSTGELIVAESKGNSLRRLRLPGAEVYTGLKLSLASNTGVYSRRAAVTARLAAPDGSSSKATGTVAFSYNSAEGAVTLGAAPLVNGAATLNAKLENVGFLKLNAEYLGDGGFAPTSTFIRGETGGADVPLLVTPLVTVSLNSASAVGGQPVTLRASVLPANQDGSIEFRDGDTVLGKSSLLSGESFLTSSDLAAGGHSITAVYLSADFPPSPSEQFPFKVKKRTVAQLVSSRNPAREGDSVTFHALLSPASASGSVSFFDNGDLVGTARLNSDFPGTAAWATNSLGSGNHSISVKFDGDDDTGGAASAPLAQTVLGGTTVRLFASPLNPTVGQAVTYTAVVIPQSATGTVRFSDNGVSIGSVSIREGSASIVVPNFTFGPHNLVAGYGGDANLLGASSQTLQQSAARANSSVFLIPASNPAVSGQTLGITVQVTPPAATGTVRLLDGETILATITLQNGRGSVLTTALGLGVHSLQAVYSGDSYLSPSSSPVVVEVVRGATTIILSASTSSPAPGSQVVLTALIAPRVATGNIQFFDGATSLGTVAISAGTASLVVPGFTAGAHSIRAVYYGDGLNMANSSNPLSLAVR